MIYKLKHKPTGLYFQPHKHRGSHLSKKGKIYQTKSNGLSSAVSGGHKMFRINCQKDSHIHKSTKDTLAWQECRWNGMQLYADTLVSDWEVEPL